MYRFEIGVSQSKKEGVLIKSGNKIETLGNKYNIVVKLSFVNPILNPHIVNPFTEAQHVPPIFQVY